MLLKELKANNRDLARSVDRDQKQLELLEGQNKGLEADVRKIEAKKKLERKVWSATCVVPSWCRHGREWLPGEPAAPFYIVNRF